MWQVDMVRKLSDARCSRGGASLIMAEYEAMTGKSRQQLYRIAKRHGYEPCRRRRSDMGVCTLTEAQLTWISAMLKETAREVKGVIMPVEAALMAAEDNGIVGRGEISVSRLQEILRDRGMGRAAIDAADPHIRMRSLHPNHVHVVDMSVCIQFYLKGRLRIMPENKFYKNKWANFVKVRKKLIRYVLQDHFSGAIYVKYYYSAGETAENLFDFLCSAWRGGKHEKFPFRGVPFYVLHDKGSANISHAIQGFLRGLEIDVPKSLPHNPRRQGSAECAQNLVESWFESRLKIQSATTIEELNEWALDWAVWFNAERVHTRHRMTRTACWSQIRSEHLRELPEDEILQEIFANPTETRQVRGDYSISYKGKTYDVRHLAEVVPGVSSVEVRMRPYHYPEVCIRWKDADYLVRPVGAAAGGFREDAAVIGLEYKAMPESVVQKAKKRMENAAYGEDRRKDQAPFEGAVVVGHLAEKVVATPLPRRGVLHIAAMRGDDAGERRIGMVEFLLERLKPALGGTIPKDINQAVRERYGASITVAEAARLVAAARGGSIVAAITEATDDTAAANS